MAKSETAADGLIQWRRASQAFRHVVEIPEVVALVGLALVFGIFSLTAGGQGFLTIDGIASVLNVAAQFGMVGAAVTLLLIGGEFDLSVGSVVGLTGYLYAVAISAWGWPIWFAIAATLFLAAAIGFVNGLVVVKTGMPSFIVTLAGLFSYRGLAIGLAYAATATPFVGGLDSVTNGDALAQAFGGTFFRQFQTAILWWLGISLLCWYVLTRTRFGNWIYATGGARNAARGLGVPITRVKVLLFVFTALTAGILAVSQVTNVGGADSTRGVGKEFEAAIVAVIGGTYLYGGVGNPLGTVVGALTLAIVEQGLFFVGVPAQWYQFVLGFLLLAAVLANNFVLRNRAGGIPGS